MDNNINHVFPNHTYLIMETRIKCIYLVRIILKSFIVLFIHSIHPPSVNVLFVQFAVLISFNLYFRIYEGECDISQ